MYLLIIDLLYGFGAALLGALGASWLCRIHFQRKLAADADSDAQNAAGVLVRLHDLATRVAVDVDNHSSQVKEISDELAVANSQGPAQIVDVVAKLIDANHQMQEKLTSTEDKLRQQAQQMQAHVAEARTDALTLLANRRAFDDELSRRFAEFRRHGRGFSVTMVDVDHFKKFNDVHGHQAGDEVLRDVARLLRRKMREMDVVARYGGEEFAIIHPGTTLNEASMAALRACEAIERSKFSHDGKELCVTVSLGVAEVLGHEDAASVVARADQALYASKQGGRNCAHRHDGEAINRIGSNRQPVIAESADDRQSQPAPRCEENNARVAGVQNAAPAASQPDSAGSSLSDLIAALPGRTAICQQVRSRMAEWKRGGPAFSVALIEVNEHQSEGENSRSPARDFATRIAAGFLAGTIREMDVLGSYAPGCFALMLPTAGLADAIQVAERIREGFSEYNASASAKQPRLALSVGVVQAMQADDSTSLLTRAEAALDAADRRGGDRSYCHDGERCAPVTEMLQTMDSSA